MALSRESLARRIREALAQSGVSQRDLAQSVGMDETALSKALAGRRNFSSLEVARIAERLSLRTDALFADDEDRYRETLRFAARLQAGAVDGDGVRKAVAFAEELWELDRLLSDLGFPAGDRPALPVVPRGNAIAQGTELARRVRGDLAEPLPAQIDDLAEWIERRLGADVCITRLPTGVDGLAVTRDTLRLILVSSTVSATRQRFTTAHEICHLVADDAQDMTVDEDVFGRLHKSQERRANAFAAEFLVPAETLRAEVAGRALDEDTIVDLLGTHRVSLDMLAFRLHNVNIVNAVDRDRIRAMRSARIAVRPGRSDDLRARNEHRPPEQLLDRALHAFADGKLGIRPLAGLLSLDPEQLIDELTPPRFKVADNAGDAVYAL